MMFSMIVIALPVTVIVSKFTRVYAKYKDKIWIFDVQEDKTVREFKCKGYRKENNAKGMLDAFSVLIVIYDKK